MADDVSVTFSSTSLSRFDVIESAAFQPYGSPQFAFKRQVVRVSSAWAFSFAKLADLPSARFDCLRKILDAGGDVDVLGGEHIGDLCSKYDSLAPMDYLAKGALLNLYAVLCDEVDPVSDNPWIEFVSKIVRIGRERFVAEVDVGVYESVSTILKFLDTRFLSEPNPVAAGHAGNIPGYYGPFDSMLSVKKWYRQGNVQWTVSRIPRPGDNPIFLLDCDMDEHANLASARLTWRFTFSTAGRTLSQCSSISSLTRRLTAPTGSRLCSLGTPSSVRY